MTNQPLSGVFAAAVTPLSREGETDVAGMNTLLDFLASQGCHGALILGTTGEGPSFSPEERQGIWQAAANWRSNKAPNFILLAGTGTPSLSESSDLTRMAFDLGYEAVCVLPPFFFRNASEDGLYDWFAQIIDRAVPQGKWLLGYHIPAVSGVALPISLLQRLNDDFPTRFGGLKDSSGSLKSARAYADGLPGKSIFVGNDKLLGPGLSAGATGCITAGANLWSQRLREIYDAHHRGEDTSLLQKEVDAMRALMDAAPPAPAYAKAMLHKQNQLPFWSVKPPLRNFSEDQMRSAFSAIQPLTQSA